MVESPTARPRGRPRDPEVDICILGAAVDLLTEGGFEKLTMEAVASRAGVAKASIYRRFASRVDLIVAMCQAFIPAAVPDIDTGSLRDDLVELADYLATTLGDKHDTGRLLPSMLAAAKENSEVREALARFSSGRRRRIHDIVGRAVERGELAPGTDADVIGDLIAGSIIYRTMIRGADVDAAFTTSAIDGLLSGFSAG